MRLVIGDLHLGLSWDGLDRTGDILYVLNEIYKRYENYQNIEDIIWLGDIFDSPNPSHRVITDFIRLLKRFNSVIKGNHIILKGNHDGDPSGYKGSPLLEVAECANVKVIFEPTIIGNDLYAPYIYETSILDQYKDKFHTCFSHLNIDGMVPGMEMELARHYVPTLPLSLIKRCGRVFGGHIHTPQIKDNVCIVGSLLKFCTAEAQDHKGIVEISEEAMTFVPISSRELVRFDFNVVEFKDLEPISALLSGLHDKQIQNAIVSVHIICSAALAHKIDLLELKNYLTSRCFYVRMSMNLLKDKQLRLEIKQTASSDADIVKSFLDKQGIANKQEILDAANKIMEN